MQEFFQQQITPTYGDDGGFVSVRNVNAVQQDVHNELSIVFAFYGDGSCIQYCGASRRMK